MPSAHAKCSPSSASIWFNCAGQPDAVASLPPEERDRETEASLEGTHRHKLFELGVETWDMLKAGLGDWPEEIDGRPVTPEDIGIVEQALRMLDELDLDWSTVQTETKVNIGQLYGLDDLCWGTVDLLARKGSSLYVVDLKTGGYPVSPDSLQLRLYAVGALYNHAYEIDEVNLVILQPKVSPVPKVYRAAPKEVTKWSSDACDTLFAVAQQDPPRTPGEHCRWCAYRGKCPERTGLAMSAAASVFKPIAEGPPPRANLETLESLADTALAEPVESLSPEHVGRILDLAILFEGWVSSVRARAQKMAEEGHPPPGWKLVAGRGSREWSGDDEAAVVAGLKRCGLTLADIYRKTVVSPAQAEKLDKIRTSRKAQAKLAALIIKKEGKPRLAPESDPSPALDRGSVFQPIDDTPEWA